MGNNTSVSTFKQLLSQLAHCMVAAIPVSLFASCIIFTRILAQEGYPQRLYKCTWNTAETCWDKLKGYSKLCFLFVSFYCRTVA